MNEPSLAEKLRFLQSQHAYPGLLQAPTALETHMSWLFFAGDRVFKLKKPVRFPFLDFTTLQARAFYCQEELRLNARLAPDVYLGLFALQTRGRELALVPAQELPAKERAVEWLVAMRRLPEHRMLHHLMAKDDVDPREVEALIGVLAGFYRRATRVDVPAREYAMRLQREQAVNREVLLRPQFALHGADLALNRFELQLARNAHLLHERACQGHLVDGHGDLRPEHVCMLEPPVVIDCLEFNPTLRQTDPLSEICFLALECDMAGAQWIGRMLLRDGANAWGGKPQPQLLHLYAARHALLRARLAMAHLLDTQPRSPAKWPPVAQRYVDRALTELRAMGAMPTPEGIGQNA